MDIKIDNAFSFRGNLRTEPGNSPVQSGDDLSKFEEVKMVLAASR
jgi:hypothetical protein